MHTIVMIGILIVLIVIAYLLYLTWTGVGQFLSVMSDPDSKDTNSDKNSDMDDMINNYNKLFQQVLDIFM